MPRNSIDQAPPMITFTIGEEDDQLILSIPEASLKNLEAEEKERKIKALSRFILALGNGKEETLEEDLAIVATIDGMLMTVPGSGQPVSFQEIFGSMLITGSPEDLAKFQDLSE